MAKTRKVAASALDTIESIALANGVEDWHLLEELNKSVKNLNVLGSGTVVELPWPDLGPAKDKLKNKARDAAAYFGGRSYLEPMELIAASVFDGAAAAKSGKPFKLLDERGKVAAEGTLTDKGLVAKNLARRLYRVLVDDKELGSTLPAHRTFRFELPAWIELELKDEDGKPVANEPYRVTAADGTVLEGKLDAGGTARVDVPSREDAEVSFPALADGEWYGVKPEAEPEPEKKAWVELELLDAKGNPLAGELFRVTLAGGKLVEGVLDDSGRVRLEGLAEGDVEVTFPNLDAADWAL